jgi:hypothetical protein
MTTTTETFTDIARTHLGIGTLRVRGRDALDFHDVSVGNVQRALAAAFEAGRASASQPTGTARHTGPPVTHGAVHGGPVRVTGCATTSWHSTPRGVVYIHDDDGLVLALTHQQAARLGDTIMAAARLAEALEAKAVERDAVL